MNTFEKYTEKFQVEIAYKIVNNFKLNKKKIFQMI